MANPNIAGLSTISGNTVSVIPSVNTAVVLLANASNSSNVYKIGLITVANLSPSAQTATVAYYTNGAQAANTAPSSGVTYALANGISIPAGSSLVVVDKTSPFYITENQSIVVTSSYANQLVFTTSYEQIF